MMTQLEKLKYIILSERMLLAIFDGSQTNGGALLTAAPIVSIGKHNSSKCFPGTFSVILNVYPVLPPIKHHFPAFATQTHIGLF
jgi:hypothetical protein